MADANAWKRFLQIFTLTIGAGLMLAGIIFFFAYNWESMHRFAKMGIAVGLILAVFGVTMLVKMSDTTRKITISSLCVLVGLFWAIFGQVYQTDADTYEFFLTWAVCVAVWVYMADFYPLWTFFIGLVSMGVIPLFPINEWLPTLLMLYTAAWIAFFIFTPKVLPNRSESPSWFINMLITLEFGIAVFVMCVIIVFGDEGESVFMVLVVIGATIWYTLRQKNLWLFTMLFIGGLCVLECLFIKGTNFDFGVLFFNLIIMTAALVASAFAIVKQHKKWKQENLKPSTNQEVINNGNDQQQQ